MQEWLKKDAKKYGPITSTLSHVITILTTIILCALIYKFPTIVHTKNPTKDIGLGFFMPWMLLGTTLLTIVGTVTEFLKK